nr:putative protein TPRXL [Aedes albopictus]
MDCDPASSTCLSDTASVASLSGSESDAEPSPKKCRRLASFLARKNSSLLPSNEDDSSSPNSPLSAMGTSSSSSAIKTTNESALPSNVDPDVFHALPVEVQKELLENWRISNPASSSSSTSISSGSSSSSSKNTLHRYFVKNA